MNGQDFTYTLVSPSADLFWVFPIILKISMVIKYNKSIKRIVHYFERINLPLIFVLILVFIIGNIYNLAAEPFIRICKNGVIYYYFANKMDETNPDYNMMKRQVRIPPPSPQNRLGAKDLEPLIKSASQQHNLPESLIKAVIRVESNFNPSATSPKGAQGLMQLLPRTADQLQVVNPYDIQENIWGGTRYLRWLLEKFNHNLPLALAAYNAGPQRVEQHRGIPPIRETQWFVRDVCSTFLQYSAPPLKRDAK
jgi:soluble lytic murein transglycosylase-like protein